MNAMSECRICAGRNVEPILNLGHHPLADRFLTKDLVDNTSEVTWPLCVHLCADCGYAGLHVTVDEHERYQAADYSYTAGNSPVSVKHFDELAKAILLRCGTSSTLKFAVDIGGNDGTLLAAIHALAGTTGLADAKPQRLRLLNLEPSGPMMLASLDRGIDALGVFWGQGMRAADLVGVGKVDLFTATNVMNHASDPCAFVGEIATGLRDGGWFVFEVPSLAELVRQGAWDTIYLEHVSYFGARSLTRLLNDQGLTIEHVELTPYMGGSYRVFARKRICGALESGWRGPVDPDSLYVARAYEGTMVLMQSARRDLRDQVHEARAGGAEVFAIGAAAKGNTLLNYCKFGPQDISCVLDTSPHKIGKYTPGSHIPIVDEIGLPEQIKLGIRNPYAGQGMQGMRGMRNAALILPWNIADHLTAKYRHLNVNFIVPPQGLAGR